MGINHPSYPVITASRRGAPDILFDFDEASTWDRLPQAEITFWTFPAVPVEQVRAFYLKKKQELGNIVLMGSTSALIPQQEHGWVNESTHLDTSEERVLGEIFLQEQGARLVLSSGIYGPHRNPMDWIKKGLVGRSEKFVNMIHVEDLCQFLWNASQFGRPAQVYIASDGNPQTWNSLIAQWEKKSFVKDVPVKASAKPSKRVDSSYSIAELQIRLKFSDVADIKS